MAFRRMQNDSKDLSATGRRRLAQRELVPAEQAVFAMPDTVAGDRIAQVAHAELTQRLGAPHNEAGAVTVAQHTVLPPASSRAVEVEVLGPFAQSARRSDPAGSDPSKPHFMAPDAYFAELLASEGGVCVKREKDLHAAETLEQVLLSAPPSRRVLWYTRKVIIAEVEAALRLHAQLLQERAEALQVRRSSQAAQAATFRRQRRGNAELEASTLPRSARLRSTARQLLGTGSASVDESKADTAAERRSGSGRGLSVCDSMATILAFGSTPPATSKASVQDLQASLASARSGTLASTATLATAARVRRTPLLTDDLRGMAVADPVLRGWILERYRHYKALDLADAAKRRDRQASRAHGSAASHDTATLALAAEVDVAASTASLPVGGGGSPGAVGTALVSAATQSFEEAHPDLLPSDSDSEPEAGWTGLSTVSSEGGDREDAAAAAAAAGMAASLPELAELDAVLAIFRAHTDEVQAPTLRDGARITQAGAASRRPGGVATHPALVGPPPVHQPPAPTSPRPRPVDPVTGLPTRRPRIPTAPSSASLRLLASASVSAAELPIVPPLQLFPPDGDADQHANAAVTAAHVARAMAARSGPQRQGAAIHGVPAAAGADRARMPASQASARRLAASGRGGGGGGEASMATPHPGWSAHNRCMSARDTKAMAHDPRLDMLWRDCANFGAVWSARRDKATRHAAAHAAQRQAAEEATHALQQVDAFQHALEQRSASQSQQQADKYGLDEGRAGDVFPGIWARGEADGLRATRGADATGMLDARRGVSRVYDPLGPHWGAEGKSKSE